MNFIKKAAGIITLISLSLSSSVSAQTTDIVHSQSHRNLIADQVNIYKEINLLDSIRNQFLIKQEEKKFPALDLYSDSWDNTNVDPYTSAKITTPDSMNIDVSNYYPPAQGRITSDFGWRRSRMHKGIDIKVYTGDTIYAAFDGKVRIRRYERRGYGYFLVVRHNNGLETVYGHLSKFLVSLDQEVKAGEPIALGGNTGRSTGSHLHFETRFLGVAINPNEILDFKNHVAHTDEYMFRTKRAKLIASGMMGPNGIAYHTIKSGDTLGRIANKYGISVTQLCRLNNINSRTILKIGRRLRYS